MRTFELPHRKQGELAMRLNRLFREIQSSIQELFPIRVASISKIAVCCVLALGISEQNLAKAQASEAAETPSQIVQSIDDAKLVRLTGNTHPLARQEDEVGRVDPDLPMEHMLLVLQRSPEQDAALDRFMAEQYNPESGNFHHWLTAREFGRKYGPSDADLATVTAWLQTWGFRVDKIGKGRTFIEFSGTANDVEQAFHVEMHRYLVKGVEHIANDRDPQIPEALAPVVAGVTSLHNFFPKPLSVFGDVVKRNKKTGQITPLHPAQENPAPQFVFTDSSGVVHEDITPFDFATIYNLLPLWNAGITGKGETIAISAASDIEASDVAIFRSAFGLPANPVKVIHNEADPGFTGTQIENTLDVEWAGATGPDATIVLVVTGPSTTMPGYERSDIYIVDEGVAPIMSASYGDCELFLGSAGNSMYNKIWQQGAAEGISIFESAGDQGSTGCDNSDLAPPAAAIYGLQVNGMASSPFVTAVGGTDLDWQGNRATYWNASNNGLGANAKGYIPEIPWNPTCANNLLASGYGYPSAKAFCNAIWPDLPNLYPFVRVAGGSGGVSACTTPTGTTPPSCAGGYAKPAWQTGTGVPNDGKRDLPDISLFASDGYSDIIPGSAYLICYSPVTPGLIGTCHDGGDSTLLQEIGGTSVSSPAMAGIMALVLQKSGAIQGLANPVLYELAAKENLTTCNSSTVGNGSSCVFYDVTKGNNNQVCYVGKPNCVTSDGQELGVVSGYGTNKGYDLATGLGSVNATNLVNAWASAIGKVTLSPTSLTFPSTAVGVKSAAQEVTLKNTGGGALAIWAMDFAGTDHSSFSGTTTCPFAPTRLGAGDGCTISITFTPASSGTLTAQLNIYDNASGQKQVVNLTGTGN
jgi:subtilase family serine protease